MTTIFRPLGRVVLGLALLLSAGCTNFLGSASAPTPAAPGATSQPPATLPAVPPAAPAPAQPYEKAVLAAANALLGNAKLPPEGTPAQARYAVVIDPLIDGMTGAQSVATQSMGVRLSKLMREQYPQYEVQTFSAANVARSPLVLIGTFTGVNSQRQTTGQREAYRICLALADLRSGKLVSKGLAFALPDGVDPTPLAFFRDAPAWAEDPATTGYIKTCQGTKAGDPINPLYLDRILAATLVAQAIDAYNAGRYREALELYQSAQATPAGNQFRVHNGIYLANWKLGRQAQARAAFGRIVDFGIEQQRLAIKFLFRPGSTAFMADPKISGPYPVWLKTIASRTAASSRCLEITGHTSPTGPEPLNERLSQLRAEYVKTRLAKDAPQLAKRLISNGMGSRQTMIGNGRDDATDALDRRVEFKVIGC
jgi:outer membrane protein OmpA-like peptidoglycan-associated protein